MKMVQRNTKNSLLLTAITVCVHLHTICAANGEDTYIALFVAQTVMIEISDEKKEK